MDTARASAEFRLESLEQRRLFTGSSDASELVFQQHSATGGCACCGGGACRFPAINVDLLNLGDTLGSDAFDTFTGPLAAGSPLSSLPQLNSLPGAAKQIYLDFNGAGAMTWGSYSVPATPAYDTDNDPSTFSAAELSAINQVWARVAEMYSPFNINVTTVDPGSYARGTTVRILIGGDGAWAGRPGGIGYLNGFTASFSNAQTVHVFPKNLGNGNAKYVAAAAAHEAGHAFGLQHQSTYSGSTKTAEYRAGTSLTGPIMGNSYYSARDLWSNGQSAVSSTTLQDDMAVIARSTNGFGFKADDYANTFSSAFTLTPVSGVVTASGLINAASDIDWFAFTTSSGTVSFSVAPAQFGGMLDASLRLATADGLTLTTIDTASLGETLTLNLSAGAYRIAVLSKGNYGDVGTYTLAGTVVSTSPDSVAAPSAVSLARSPEGPVVSWADNSSNETGFRVERAASGSSDWSVIATPGAGVTSVTDATALVGQSYQYRVTAVGSVEESQASAVVTFAYTPDAPSTVNASGLTSRRVAISWADVEGETGYRIERSTNGTSWTLVSTAGVGVTSYEDASVSPATRYFYRVVATSAAGNSAAATSAAAPTVPDAPAACAAAATGTAAVRLSWAAATGASGYRIEQQQGDSWTTLTNLTGGTVTSFLVNNLSENTAYVFRIVAQGVGGASSASTASSATQIAAPAAVTASPASASSVIVGFGAVAGASGYKIERAAAGSSAYTLVATIDASSVGATASVTVSSLTAGAGYQFRVRAVGVGGDSAPSATASVTTLPAAPSSLTATAVSPTRVNLAWSDVAGETGYHLQRSTDGSTWQTVATTAAGVLTYADTALTSDTTYFYRVTAYNASGDGLASTTAFATPSPLLAVSQPGNVVASVSGPSSVVINWADASGNESGFRIQRTSDGGLTWRELGSLRANVTTFTDTTVARNTTYAYRVQAFNQYNVSEFSGASVVVTPPPDATGLRRTGVSASSVSLGWDLAPGATAYRIEYATRGLPWTEAAIVGGSVDRFDLTGLSAGVAYSVRVTAMSAAGSASPSAALAVTTIPAPVALTGEAVTVDSAELFWVGVSGATGYRLEISTDNATWAAVGTYDNRTFTAIASGLSLDTSYYFRVITLGVSGESSPGNTVEARPVPQLAVATPRDLTVSALSPNQARLNWTDASDNERGFIIQVSVDGGRRWRDAARLGAGVTEFTHSRLSRGVTYQYRVFAFNKYTRSLPSDVATVTTPPADVTTVRLRGVTANTATLIWRDVAGELGYRVERSSDGITYEPVASQGPGSTGFIDTDLSAGHAYFYRVIAFNSGGEAVAGNAVGFMTAPAAPATLVATPLSAGVLHLEWTNVDGESAYVIERSIDGVRWKRLATTRTDVSAVVITGLSDAREYQYRVRAANRWGVSDLSPTASAVASQPVDNTLPATLLGDSLIRQTRRIRATPAASLFSTSAIATPSIAASLATPSSTDPSTHTHQPAPIWDQPSAESLPTARFAGPTDRRAA